MGAISSLSSFSRRGFSLSGPAALLAGLRLFKNLRSPFREVLTSGMSVAESSRVSGMESEGKPLAFIKSCTHILARRERDRGSLAVKTELNCWLKRLALVLVSEWRMSSCFSDGVPCWSRHEFFKNVKSFLLLHLFSSSVIFRCKVVIRIAYW